MFTSSTILMMMRFQPDSQVVPDSEDEDSMTVPAEAGKERVEGTSVIPANVCARLSVILVQIHPSGRSPSRVMLLSETLRRYPHSQTLQPTSLS